MSDTKFTPGPWQINGSHVYGPDPQRELVAQAHGDGEGAWSAIGGSRMCANRNLIAAAPDLAELVEFYFKGIVCSECDKLPEAKICDHCQKAHTILAELGML